MRDSAIRFLVFMTPYRMHRSTEMTTPSQLMWKLLQSRLHRADGGPETGFTDYQEFWIFGTHSAIGGAPWRGDMPTGHSLPNDQWAAVESDQFIREKALSTNVPVDDVDEYGYQYIIYA